MLLFLSLMTLASGVLGKMQVENFQTSPLDPPTEEERAARLDRGPGKPRKFREEDKVLVLTDSNMGVALEQYDLLLVEFYAPWCGHCKKLAPEYSAAAAELQDEEIKLGKVDCTTSKKLHQKYKIEGFPTMYFFKYGKQHKYTGGNQKDSIVEWVRRHSLPSTVELSSIESVKEKQGAHSVVLVGYFPSTSHQNGKKSYFHLSENKDHLNFFTTNSSEVANYLGLGAGKDGIVILKTFDEEKSLLDLTVVEESSADQEVARFITSHSYPLISVFSKQRAREIFSPKITTHILVFTDTTASHHAPSILAVTKLAKQFRGTAQVISIESEDDNILTHFKVEKGSLPAIVVMDVDAMERYPFVPESGSTIYDEGQYDKLAEHVQSVIDKDF